MWSVIDVDKEIDFGNESNKVRFVINRKKYF